MEEKMIAGYCRVLDQSRMVSVETEGKTLCSADCNYGSCMYESTCTIALQIRELTEKAPHGDSKSLSRPGQTEKFSKI